MSQFWHSHWAEATFKPVMLGNWEVPNWHPKWPCAKHCVTTTFLADRMGRLLPDRPRSNRSPWGDYKSTWQLPTKIDRKLAQKLSAPPKYKLVAWQAHKESYERRCELSPASLQRAKTRDVTKQQKLRNTGVAGTSRKRGGGNSSTITAGAAGTEENSRMKDPKYEERCADKDLAKDEGKNVEEEKGETKKSRKNQCLCVDKPQTPKEVPQPKRNICTVHQRLRV